MGYETNIKRDVKEMDFYIKTGCVHNSYLREVLGEQSTFIGNNPIRIEEVLEMFE